jgi:hypothetical protein
MAADLTYRQLLRETRALAREVRRDTEAHRKLATKQDEEAQDTGRIAEQIAALGVDAATVAETREVSRIMKGLSNSALSYATTAEEASRAAKAAENEAVTTHGGIQEAVDRSPVDMAKSEFYTQE